jgi:hypothetical protein
VGERNPAKDCRPHAIAGSTDVLNLQWFGPNRNRTFDAEARIYGHRPVDIGFDDTLQFLATAGMLVCWSYLPVLSVVGDKLKSRWTWPFGLLATGLAGAAVVLLRGCWHRKMSWPVRAQHHSYQVCLGCGIKRLFDEEAFRAYGPYSYDLHRLLAWDRKQQKQIQPETLPPKHRSAS